MRPKQVVILLQIAILSLTCLQCTKNQQTYPNQWQSLLILLQQNPQLIQQIRSNPALVKSLQTSLLQHQVRKTTPKPERDQCSSLRKQNARLKHMIQAVIEGYEQDSGGLESHKGQQYLNQALERRQRELGAPNYLVNRPTTIDITKTSLQRILVTPTPSWTTLLSTSSYMTMLTQAVSTEVPIIVRGSKIVTTIVEDSVFEVTATEIQTSSVLITPTPTYSTMTLTMTSSIEAASVPHQDKWPTISPTRNFDLNSDLDQIGILDFRKGQNNNARDKLDRLKQTYGIFFANSAQRSAQKNGNLFGTRETQGNPRNPLFKEVEDDFDYFNDFDHQGLAAQTNPVFVKNEVASTSERSKTKIKSSPVDNIPSSTELSKVVTLYFSGKVPGEYTTSLSTLFLTDSNRQKDSSSVKRRYKREDDYEIILPSKSIPILMTDPPSDRPFTICQVVDGSEHPFEIVGSMQTVTQTVTVTETLTAYSEKSIP